MIKNKVFIFQSTPDFSFIEIHPGDWVVLKPNLVKESTDTNPDEWESVITSPALIRQVCEYVCDSLKGKGKVTICDAPQTDSSFARIVQLLGLQEIANTCSKRYGVPIEILDLRNEEWENQGGVITARKKIHGDPEGVLAFNLGQKSLFYGFQGEGRYYGADYDSSVVNSHHQGLKQEYLVCATPIKADVFINLPKLKTHKKTGVTLNLKNLVGINADKNWLPHHTEGSPGNGGDQFPKLTLKEKTEQRVVRLTRKLALNFPFLGPRLAQKMRRAGTSIFGAGNKVIRSGNWYGNDTTWRMALDLNRCLLYGNSDATIRVSNPKRYYGVIDGIIGMEGNGPMQGDPFMSNVYIGGADPVAVDMVAARIMGFDWRKIPVIREAFTLEILPITQLRPENIIVVSDIHQWNGAYLEIENKEFFRFKPHFGWAGHVEYEKQT